VHMSAQPTIIEPKSLSFVEKNHPIATHFVGMKTWLIKDNMASQTPFANDGASDHHHFSLVIVSFHIITIFVTIMLPRTMILPLFYSASSFWICFVSYAPCICAAQQQQLPSSSSDNSSKDDEKVDKFI